MQYFNAHKWFILFINRAKNAVSRKNTKVLFIVQIFIKKMQFLGNLSIPKNSYNIIIQLTF